MEDEMKKHAYCAAVVALFAAFASADLSAQVMDRHGQAGVDFLSVGLYGGGFFPASNLGAGTEFDNTGTVGGTVTLWAHRNVGVRANVLWSSLNVVGPGENPLAGEDPDVWHYSGDVLLRLPFTTAGELSWFPYLVGGLGAKTYDFETRSTDTDFAGNYGAGVELRFGPEGRWGVNTEVRNLMSNFDRAGFDTTLNDVIWTGGFTLNF
jgi:hypothetical protein